MLEHATNRKFFRNEIFTQIPKYSKFIEKIPKQAKVVRMQYNVKWSTIYLQLYLDYNVFGLELIIFGNFRPNYLSTN